jgi:hypothetical protein
MQEPARQAGSLIACHRQWDVQALQQQPEHAMAAPAASVVTTTAGTCVLEYLHQAAIHAALYE